MNDQELIDRTEELLNLDVGALKREVSKTHYCVSIRMPGRRFNGEKTSLVRRKKFGCYRALQPMDVGRPLS
jgi:hypothetical protein